MSDCCHDAACARRPTDPAYRRVPWAALLINAAMFGIELAGGLLAGSVLLLADAIDFLGDAAYGGVWLLVPGLLAHWRAGAALLQGASVGLFGVAVLAAALGGFGTGARSVIRQALAELRLAPAHAA